MPNSSTPKNSPVRDAVLLGLIRSPWLTYKELWKRIPIKSAPSTVSVYGSSVRREIGCELKSVNGKEILVVDYPVYLAACGKHQVEAMTEEQITAASTRAVKFKKQEPPPQLAHAQPEDLVGVPFQDSVGETLTRKIEAAELRCTEATNRVKQLESQLAVALREQESAAQTLAILDELSSASIEVIRAILG